MEKRCKRHKEWRKDAKKQRRKIKRTKLALDQKLKENLKNSISSTKLAEQNARDLIDVEVESEHSAEEHKKWLEYDKKCQQIWNEKQQKIYERDRIKELERERIKMEYEIQQKRQAEIEQEKLDLLEEQKKKYKILSKKIDDFILGFNDTVPIELLEISETNPGKSECIFFTKTGCCRYGFKCIRNHRRPGLSRMLLIMNFFTNIRLEQSDATEYGTDLALEYDDSDLQLAFLDFFNDVVPEFQQFGKILQFRVCHNLDQHLRGNVYVEYENERDALKAFRHMKGRYYAGRMLNIEFSPIIPWKNAICGLSLANQCLKGRSCNYLHVFKNPHNKFPLFMTTTRHNTNYTGSLTTSLVINSTRNQNSYLATNNEKSWDEEDKNSHHRSRGRNWRWSESPERNLLSNDLSGKNVRKSSQTPIRKDSSSHQHPNSTESRQRSSDSSVKSYGHTSTRSISTSNERNSSPKKKKKTSSSKSRDKHSRRSGSSSKHSKKRKKQRSRSRS